MDYKSLLVKYIAYVGLSEGVNFIDYPDDQNKAIFTDAEFSELEKLAADANEIERPS